MFHCAWRNSRVYTKLPDFPYNCSHHWAIKMITAFYFCPKTLYTVSACLMWIWDWILFLVTPISFVHYAIFSITIIWRIYDIFLFIFYHVLWIWGKFFFIDFQVHRIIKLPSWGNVSMKDDLENFASCHFHNASFGVINAGVWCFTAFATYFMAY